MAEFKAPHMFGTETSGTDCAVSEDARANQQYKSYSPELVTANLMWRIAHHDSCMVERID